MRFEKIELDGLDVFVSGESTGFFKLATTDSDRIAGFSRYQARYMNGYKVFGLPGSLLQRVIYFPSHRRLQRKLLDRLFASGVQLITTTHSPTVIDAMVKQGAAVFRTEFDQPRNVIKIDSVKGVGESRALLDSIGASPADLLLADRVLFVEGPTEMPVFKAWLEKLPAARGQNITILSLGGSDVASDSFDPRELEKLHPKIFAILDSEIGAAGAPADAGKLKIKEKLDAVGVHCHLTERRATENYFTTAALRTVCAGLEALGPYDDPGLLARRGQQFSKRKNGLVADAMRWEDLERTDLGEALQAFLKL